MRVTLRIVSYLSLGSCFMFIIFFMIILIISNFLSGPVSCSCADSGWRIEIFSFGESSFLSPHAGRPCRQLNEKKKVKIFQRDFMRLWEDRIKSNPSLEFLVYFYSIKRIIPKSTVPTMAVARTACLLFLCANCGFPLGSLPATCNEEKMRLGGCLYRSSSHAAFSCFGCCDGLILLLFILKYFGQRKHTLDLSGKLRMADRNRFSGCRSSFVGCKWLTVPDSRHGFILAPSTTAVTSIRTVIADCLLR